MPGWPGWQLASRRNPGPWPLFRRAPRKSQWSQYGMGSTLRLGSILAASRAPGLVGDNVDFGALPVQTQVFVGFISLLTLYFHVRYNEQSVNYGPTILTTTGIFATFVGIAIGLASFNSADIQSSVPALLGGLKTAFWGSIAGVGGALTIKFRQLIFGNPKSFAGTGVEGDVTAHDLAQLLKNIQQSLVGSDDSTLITQMRLARQENNDRLDALKKAQIGDYPGTQDDPQSDRTRRPRRTNCQRVEH
jgi:hypothetical protein